MARRKISVSDEDRISNLVDVAMKEYAKEIHRMQLRGVDVNTEATESEIKEAIRIDIIGSINAEKARRREYRENLKELFSQKEIAKIKTKADYEKAVRQLDISEEQKKEEIGKFFSHTHSEKSIAEKVGKSLEGTLYTKNYGKSAITAMKEILKEKGIEYQSKRPLIKDGDERISGGLTLEFDYEGKHYSVNEYGLRTVGEAKKYFRNKDMPLFKEAIHDRYLELIEQEKKRTGSDKVDTEAISHIIGQEFYGSK